LPAATVWSARPCGSRCWPMLLPTHVALKREGWIVNEGVKQPLTPTATGRRQASTSSRSTTSQTPGKRRAISRLSSAHSRRHGCRWDDGDPRLNAANRLFAHRRRSDECDNRAPYSATVAGQPEGSGGSGCPGSPQESASRRRALLRDRGGPGAARAPAMARHIGALSVTRESTPTHVRIAGDRATHVGNGDLRPCQRGRSAARLNGAPRDGDDRNPGSTVVEDRVGVVRCRR
jgi:hypothetical protein